MAKKGFGDRGLPANVWFGGAEDGDVVVLDVVTNRVPCVGIGRFEAMDVLKCYAKGVWWGWCCGEIAPSWAGGWGWLLL